MNYESMNQAFFVLFFQYQKSAVSLVDITILHDSVIILKFRSPSLHSVTGTFWAIIIAGAVVALLLMVGYGIYKWRSGPNSII